MKCFQVCSDWEVCRARTTVKPLVWGAAGLDFLDFSWYLVLLGR